MSPWPTEYDRVPRFSLALSADALIWGSAWDVLGLPKFEKLTEIGILAVIPPFLSKLALLTELLIMA